MCAHSNGLDPTYGYINSINIREPNGFPSSAFELIPEVRIKVMCWQRKTEAPRPNISNHNTHERDCVEIGLSYMLDLRPHARNFVAIYYADCLLAFGETTKARNSHITPMSDGGFPPVSGGIDSDGELMYVAEERNNDVTIFPMSPLCSFQTVPGVHFLFTSLLRLTYISWALPL